MAKNNMIDSILKSVHIEGIKVTYEEVKAIFYGNNVTRLRLDEIQTINNLKHAWIFLLNSIDSDTNLNLLKSINALVGNNLVDRAGNIRVHDVIIGGTNWKPNLPNEEEIAIKLKELLKIECITDRAITIMCYLMREQFFSDRNKRTSMLFANKIMIQNGKGIISIPVDEDIRFGKKLIKYYETNNMDSLKQFIYNKCISEITYKT